MYLEEKFQGRLMKHGGRGVLLHEVVGCTEASGL